jgi:DGQHR domain-containing protein
MNLKAFELEQNGKKFYLTSLKAKLLTEEMLEVDLWRRDNPDGYQRDLTQSRSNAFARYIGSSKGISPLSVLLSIRGKVKFTPEKENYGTLQIPDGVKLWIVDGQHRINGLMTLVSSNPSYDDFEVPVVILPTSQGDLDPRYEEAKQFVIINRTQKGVRSDLAERFLAKLVKEEGSEIAELPRQVTRGIEWIPRAVQVVDKLNEGEGVWQGKIRLPGDPRTGTVVAQKSFTDSLKPILTNDMFEIYTVAEIAEMLSRYWLAVSELCSEAFEDPSSHVIQKTTGVFVLHRLFPHVAAFCTEGTSRARLTKERMKEILHKMKTGMTSDYWSAEGEAALAGIGQKSFSIVYSRLRDSLEEGNRKESVSPVRPFEL